MTLPAGVETGHVVCRIIQAVVDGPDEGREPDGRPVAGTVTMRPSRSMLRQPGVFVPLAGYVLPLDAQGWMTDGQAPGATVVAGVYDVSFQLDGGAQVPGFPVEVRPEHTIAAPLSLPDASPFVPTPGTPTQTLALPAGPVEGHLLGWSGGVLAWLLPAAGGGGGGGGVTDHGALTGLADDDHSIYALADGTRGAFAAPLGPDDNYVTDTEKAALHSHATVIAQGATAADARAAIGAGTSNFTGAYADLSGLPTLGTAAATDVGDYATAEQGVLAATAVQPDDVPSVQRAMVTVPPGWAGSTIIAVAGMVGLHTVAPATASASAAWAAGRWWFSSTVDGQITVEGTAPAAPESVLVEWWA